MNETKRKKKKRIKIASDNAHYFRREMARDERV